MRRRRCETTYWARKVLSHRSLRFGAAIKYIFRFWKLSHPHVSLSRYGKAMHAESVRAPPHRLMFVAWFHAQTWISLDEWMNASSAFCWLLYFQKRYSVSRRVNSDELTSTTPHYTRFVSIVFESDVRAACQWSIRLEVLRGKISFNVEIWRRVAFINLLKIQFNQLSQ